MFESVLLLFLFSLSMYSWFPVHCTSMNNKNSLISSDNKGVASLMMEENQDPGSLPGKVCH